jgi:DNA-binding beta-propeller fold protein YncE
VVVPPSLAPEAALKAVWTYQGSPASYTWAPAIDPKGRIWVAAFALDRFWVLDRDGKLVETWGQSGSGNGQLLLHGALGSAFGSIAFAPDGGFVVGDTGNHRVQRFGPDRSFKGAFGTFGTGNGQFATITGVALDSHGDIVVADNDRLDVQVFDPSGTWLRTICANNSGPLVAVDAADNLWCIAGDNQLQTWSPDGRQTRTIDLKGLITLGIGLAIGPDGHLFVSSVDPAATGEAASERLLELDSSGSLLHIWPTGGEGIAIDPAGDRIYVASVDLKRVRAYALPHG